MFVPEPRMVIRISRIALLFSSEAIPQAQEQRANEEGDEEDEPDPRDLPAGDWGREDRPLRWACWRGAPWSRLRCHGAIVPEFAATIQP